MAQKQRSNEKFDGQFSTMLEFRRKQPELKLTEVISVKRDGSILRTGKYLPPLPTENNISKIFLKSYSEQHKSIIHWWGKFLPDRREGEEMQEFYKADNCMDYYSSNFEQNRKRLEIRKKETRKLKPQCKRFCKSWATTQEGCKMN